MKIPRIEVSNILGLHRADIDITTPVLMVLGSNEAGKSSLRDAISMALLGDPSRLKIKNKKDLNQLLHDDAKKGRVTLLDGEHVFAEYKLPGGDHAAPEIAGGAFLQYVINPPMIAALPEKELSAILFQLSKCNMSPNAAAELLLKRGARPDLVDEVKPMLRSGFPAASKDAAERATQAKGAFRALTGDNWGSVQSEGWEQIIPEAPDMPDVSPEAIDAVIANHIKAAQDVENGVKYIAGLDEKVKAANGYNTRRDELAEGAGLLVRAQNKLATDQETLEELENALSLADTKLKEMQAGAVPVACPCCKELLKVTGQTLEKFTGLKADANATSTLALEVTKSKSAVDMLKRTIANDIAAVTTAENAAVALEALEKEGPPAIKAGAREAGEKKLSECRLLADKLRAKVEAMKQRQELINSADDTTAQTQAHHSDVLAWTLIADALKPDGIPADILATALKPINDSLAILSRMSGWKKVEISKDMEITADGRIYGLMSESAKWRIDTLLAAMIAQVSELKFMVLDRFDVLDQNGRGQLLNMLLDMSDMGLMDQVIVCGTLKQPMAGMPPEVGQVWIDKGQAAAV